MEQYTCSSEEIPDLQRTERLKGQEKVQEFPRKTAHGTPQGVTEQDRAHKPKNTLVIAGAECTMKAKFVIYYLVFNPVRNLQSIKKI